jgi:hypothetical protein
MFLPSRCLATIWGFLPSGCLATMGGYTYRHADWWEWFLAYFPILKNRVGLWDHVAVCVSPPPLTRERLNPLLLRKSGSAGNRTRDLWICRPQRNKGEMEGNELARPQCTFSRQWAHRGRWGCQPHVPAALYPQEDSWYSLLLNKLYLSVMLRSISIN